MYAACVGSLWFPDAVAMVILPVVCVCCPGCVTVAQLPIWLMAWLAVSPHPGTGVVGGTEGPAVDFRPSSGRERAIIGRRDASRHCALASRAGSVWV